MPVLAIYLVAMGWTEIKWPWNEMHQVFDGEGAELSPLLCRPRPRHTHTAEWFVSKERVPPGKGSLFFEEEEASVTSAAAKTWLLRIPRAWAQSFSVLPRRSRSSFETRNVSFFVRVCHFIHYDSIGAIFEHFYLHEGESLELYFENNFIFS